MKKLALKQERFVHNYIITGNATEAAKLAGYSPKRAKEIGYENLTKPHIQHAIAKQNKKLLDKFEITEERILQEYASIAFVDIIELFKADGTLKPLHEISKLARKAIGSLDVTDLFEGTGKEREYLGQLKKLKLNDKLKALDSLARTMALFKDKLEILADEDLAQLILDGRRRVQNAEK